MASIRRAAPLLVLTALTLASLALPRPAAACGGTFCDNGPQAMPVDQTGETIVFVMGGDYTEAHVQIDYDPNTDASKFAWLVPMTAVPEFAVGSQQLFLNLQNGTVPAFGFTQFFEPCDYGGEGGYYEGGCTAASSASGGGGTGGGGDDGGSTGDAPTVLLEATVGAFDVVVLESPDAGVVMTWLGDNGYVQDPNAEPILQGYIDRGYVFVAMKLTQGADVAQIHPITLTYPGSEPCVPIELTRIAAQPDMDIRAFFLAAERVGPSNYKHVVPNPVLFDWPMFAPNYKAVVTLAVDSPGADGHAFVTEYAGPSSIVDRTGIHSAAWSSQVFAGLAPTEVVSELVGQGLVQCSMTTCSYDHPLIRGVLLQFLPVPDGIDEGEFYSCLSCYEGLIDANAWDAAAFAQAIEERIVAPGAHAVAILDAWPTLTRLYTTISPQEMTEDPFFHENASLPAVDLTSQVATRTVTCEGGSSWSLPGGWVVNADGSWPTWPATMPAALRIEAIPPEGPPQVEVDNTAAIQDQLAMANAGYEGPPQRACGDLDPEDPAKGGCGCRSSGDAPLTLLLAAGGGGLYLRRRRRG